jgi:uncharacterized protein YggE
VGPSERGRRGPVPSVLVTGRAERRVVPDRVSVLVDVETAVLPTPQEALAACAAARRRLLDALRAALPDAAIADARVTTSPHQVRVVEEAGGPGRVEDRWEIAGHVGHSRVTLEGPAADAARYVAEAGGHPDAARVLPVFSLAPGLRRRVDQELQEEAVRDAIARAEGLAAAAGMAPAGVLSIGEAGTERGERIVTAQAVSSRSLGQELAEDLGELRPEPETMRAAVPVRLALARPGEAAGPGA